MPDKKPMETTDACEASHKNPVQTGEIPVLASSPEVRNLSLVPPQLRAHTIRPGEVRNPSGMKKNPFNLQARCRELGPQYLALVDQWARSDDFRASLPALRMVLATGFPEFEKALSSPNDVPPGFENLSIAQRLDALRQRRAELKQAEENVKAGGTENVVPEPIQNAPSSKETELVRPLTSSPQNELNASTPGVPHGTLLPDPPMTTAPASMPASLLTTARKPAPPPPAGRTRGTGKSAK